MLLGRRSGGQCFERLDLRSFRSQAYADGFRLDTNSFWSVKFFVIFVSQLLNFLYFFIPGTLLAYSVNLAMFMSMRVLAGFASMTVTVVSFVLVVELVSGKWRTITGILNILPVPISYILMAGIAYFVRDWRNLQLVISLPWLCLLSIW